MENIIVEDVNMDKCIDCANRVVASPECIKCDGETNFVLMEQKKEDYTKALVRFTSPTMLISWGVKFTN